MTIRIGINGFGRMGHLALRAAWGWPDLTFAHINEPGEADTAAHLLHSTRCMVAGPNDTQLTVCDNANETCPTFPHARTRRHLVDC